MQLHLIHLLASLTVVSPTLSVSHYPLVGLYRADLPEVRVQKSVSPAVLLTLQFTRYTCTAAIQRLLVFRDLTVYVKLECINKHI